MLLTVNVMRRVPWHEMGIQFRVSDNEMMSLLALVLPLALFLSAVVMFASTFARSFKEAQSYIGILILLPMLPGVLAADALGGKPAPAVFYALAGLSVIVCALVLVALTARLLKREAIIFGR